MVLTLYWLQVGCCFFLLCPLFLWETKILTWDDRGEGERILTIRSRGMLSIMWEMWFLWWIEYPYHCSIENNLFNFSTTFRINRVCEFSNFFMIYISCYNRDLLYIYNANIFWTSLSVGVNMPAVSSWLSSDAFNLFSHWTPFYNKY